MCDLYATLRNKQYFIDNDFLLKYCQVIERNKRTPQRARKTHKHHIIPRSWFKLNNLEVDNSLTNLVNLATREHFLAHYYLCLCTEDPFRYANELALVCLESDNFINSVDKELLHALPLYNNIYEDYRIKRDSNYKLYENKEESR